MKTQKISDAEAKERLGKIFKAAFNMRPTQLKNIPKKKKESSKTEKSESATANR